MSGISVTHLPMFLSFTYELIRWGGFQGDETVYLPVELSKADYWGFLLHEDQGGFGENDVWCIRYGCLMALLCDEADRMAEGWDQDLVVDADLARLGDDVAWISGQPKLREAVMDAARNPRDSTINKVICLTVLPWWQDVPNKWPETVSK